MSAHPSADVEAERDRARTEQLLDQQAADDLEQHRAEQAAGPAGIITGRIARGAW